MLYQTTRFGEIDIPDDKVLEFVDGLVGFENQKKFSILKHKPDSSFFWLQSLENPELAFSLLFPFDFIPTYSPSLKKVDLDKIECKNQKSLEFYCMVVIPKNPKDMTINLLSPIAINNESKKGVQIVLDDSSYSVYHKLIQDTKDNKQKENVG